MFDDGDGFDFIDILASGAGSRQVDHSRSQSRIWTRQLAGSGRTATVMVEVWMRPLRSVGGTRCQRWPPLSFANRAWACGPSTRNTIMPGRCSRRSRLKPPPPCKLALNAELLANEQFGVIAAFRGADFDNTHEFFSSWLERDTGKALRRLGYSEAAKWDAEVNKRFTSTRVSQVDGRRRRRLKLGRHE